MLAAHALVEVLRAGLGEAVRQRLQHDARVVVVRLLEALDVLLDADARGDGERADVVARAARLRRDEVREALVRLAGRLALLLAQEAQRRGHLAARLVRVDLDVIADRVGGEQPDDRAHFAASAPR